MATASPAESAFPPKPTPTPPDSEAPLAPGKLPEAEKPTLPEKDCGCDVPVAVMAGQDGPSMSGVHATPTTAELAKAGDLPLLDAEGKSYTFKSIYEDTSVDRHLIIFVRHFFCSICQEYLRTIAAGISQSAISSLTPRTKLTIVGCGDPALIGSYVKETSLPYPIYTDPTAALYKALNMGRTLDLGSKKPEYLGKKSMWQVSLAGVKQSLMAGSRIFKGGDWSQIGGEFLFVRGMEGWSVKWCHRMETTRDHAEVRELKEVIGL